MQHRDCFISLTAVSTSLSMDACGRHQPCEPCEADLSGAKQGALQIDTVRMAAMSTHAGWQLRVQLTVDPSARLEQLQ